MIGYTNYYTRPPSHCFSVTLISPRFFFSFIYFLKTCSLKGSDIASSKDSEYLQYIWGDNGFLVPCPHVEVDGFHQTMRLFAAPAVPVNAPHQFLLCHGKGDLSVDCRHGHPVDPRLLHCLHFVPAGPVRSLPGPLRDRVGRAHDDRNVDVCLLSTGFNRQHCCGAVRFQRHWIMMGNKNNIKGMHKHTNGVPGSS